MRKHTTIILLLVSLGAHCQDTLIDCRDSLVYNAVDNALLKFFIVSLSSSYNQSLNDMGKTQETHN